MVLFESKSTEAGASTMRCPDDTLIGEGYLVMARNSLKAFEFNHSRWFRLTEGLLSFCAGEGGAVVGSCSLSNITAVRVVDEVTFKVQLTEPFTRTGSSEVLLSCRDKVSRNSLPHTLHIT